jgi:uncharacterized membrane protein (UPF0127 family)
MNTYIQYSLTKLINFLLLFLVLNCLFIACNDEVSFKNYASGTIELPSGERLITYLAINEKQQMQGLSHLKDDQFKDNQAMLFVSNRTSFRQFWMPETFFDLDIIFLNKDLYVLDIHRKLAHFTKKGPRELVPISKRVRCRHVLEIKSSSPLANKIQPGMMLKWLGPKSLEQTILDTHPQQ